MVVEVVVEQELRVLVVAAVVEQVRPAALKLLMEPMVLAAAEAVQVVTRSPRGLALAAMASSSSVIR